MTSESPTIDDQPHVPTLDAPEPSRPKSKEAVLGDQVIVIKRLGTRDGLAVAQRLLRFTSELQEPIAAAYKRFEEAQKEEGQEEGDRTGDYMAIAMQMIEAITKVLEDDDLLKVLARLVGQDVQVVGAAPLEDTMNAVADAFSINDMPALLRAASRIWEEAQKMGARL